MNFYEQIFSRGRATGEGMTHFERLFAAKFGGSPPPEVREYTGAVPVTITADGTPLIDYLISGNTSQSGTPTPENPIIPQGTGERTRNLAYNRINATNVGSNGTIVRTDVYDVAIGRVESGIVYTTNSYVFAFYTNEPTIGSASYDGSRIVATPGSPTTFTAPITGYVAFRVESGEQAMLNLGSQPLSYEPFGVKIPISSGDTTTNNYLGEVESTRRIKKLVLTGEENWKIWAMPSGSSTQRFYINISGVGSYLSLCSHFIREDGNEDVIHFRFGGGTYNELVFFINNNISTVADFKAYLQQQYAAGTPVCVWYVLATPQTAVVNESLMRIGDYADTLSKAQAGVEIPTNSGSTMVDVDTTVKPSEVYIKYMG